MGLNFNSKMDSEIPKLHVSNTHQLKREINFFSLHIFSIDDAVVV